MQPKYVWWQGSTRTRWEAYTPPDLAAMRGLLLRETGREKAERKGITAKLR